MADPFANVPEHEWDALREAQRRERAKRPQLQHEDHYVNGVAPEPPPIEAYAEATSVRIAATRYAWRPAHEIPPREFLYGRHYIRKYVGCTIAPGGIGKSVLIIAEALAMVTGRELLGRRAPDPLSVWLWNGEDPREEMERRIAAVCQRHRLEAVDLGDRLYLDSGRDMPICIARQQHGDIIIAEPVIDAVERTIRENNIDVVVLDPFVSTHMVGENDNGAIDRVVKQWAYIADACNVAVELVHHTRKPSSGTSGEITVDDGRGAGALIGAVRSARVLNRMTKEEAEAAGVENHRLYFRVDNGKANLAPPSDDATWCYLENVNLPNGDAVGIVVPWAWPDPFSEVSAEDARAVQKAIAEGDWREDQRAKNWAGNAVAQVLGLDLSEKSAKASVRGMLKTWIKNGALKAVSGRDAKRRSRTFIEVGQWLGP